MARLSRAIGALYSIPVVGPVLSAIGSMVRIGQWRIDHAVRLDTLGSQAAQLQEAGSRQAALAAALARELEEARAAAAAREAQLIARLDALDEGAHLQAAVTSAVQRMAQGEVRDARLAAQSANAMKEDFEHLLADLLNAATLSEARTAGLRDGMAAMKGELAAAGQRLGQAEALAKEHRALVDQLLARADSIEAVTGKLASSTLEREVRAQDQHAALQAMVSALRSDIVPRITGFEEELRRRAADLEARMASLHEGGKVAELERTAIAMRDELWRRAGALEGALAIRVAQIDETVARVAVLEAGAKQPQPAPQDSGKVTELEQVTIALRDELWRRAGALEAEVALRAARLDETIARLAVLEAGADRLSPSQGYEKALAELDASVKGVQDELWARTGALQAELAKRVQQLDEVGARLASFGGSFNPVEMAASLGNLRDSVQYLMSRVEFVRREALFEMRYGAPAATGAKPATQPRVIDAAKVKKLAPALKVNVGCGHITMPGYVNVDRRELPGVDVVAEANNMPFGGASLAELYSAHLIEHFPQEQLRREILPYWKGLLKPKGKLRAVVPDADAMIREFAAGRYGYDELREVTFGGQDYDGDFHFNMFTPESLSSLLREAGFSKVEVVERGRRNGACYEFELVAS